jgi:PAS domain S-box-containing protein
MTAGEKSRTENDDARLRDAIDSLREGVQILSPTWRYLYVNEAAARHGRKSPEDLLGRTMLECYPGIEATEVFSVLERCMKERATESLENEFEYADGQRAWFELRVQPCPEGLIVLSLDVTERKRLEASLHRGEKLRALGELAAGIAHDLRNIYNPIALNVRLLRSRFERREDGDELLTRIEDALRTAQETVESLRGFSKEEPERPPEAGDLNRLVDAAIGICLPRIRTHASIEIRRERDETPSVLVRGSELVNAVVNLVVNALEALPAKGTITARTGRAEGGGFVEVEDDGPGMPPETEHRAFEPLFTTKADGTGLGLAIVYAFVQRSGGRVTLRTALGRGTSIRLWFPEAKPVEEAVKTPREAPLRHGHRLLVVEDEPAAREALAMLLEDEGYTVEPVASGEAALERLAELAPDVLLVDFQLPGIDGATVIERARAWNATLPVVLLSGRDESDAAMVALLREPHTERVGKPIDLGKLLSALDRLLEAPRR